MACVLWQDGRLTDSAGTYAFFAPEVCAGEEYNAYKADVWALGVTLYAFVHGKLPFWADGGMQPLFDAIKTQVRRHVQGWNLYVTCHNITLSVCHFILRVNRRCACLRIHRRTRHLASRTCWSCS